MSKKSFNEFYNDYLNNQELYKHIQRRKEAMEISWNFCDSQYEGEIEELKAKFSEATKTYTNDIDRLEKENSELKEKNKNLQCALDESTNEDPFRFTSYCQGMIYEYDDEIRELKKKLDEAVFIMRDLEKEKEFSCESFICDSCPMTCYDMKAKRLKMFLSINKELLKGV